MNITMRSALECSEKEAQDNLEKAVEDFLHEARWCGLNPKGSKIWELQKPLLQLKLARRKK